MVLLLIPLSVFFSFIGWILWMLKTEKGRAFLPVLVCALEWAQRWYPDPEGPAVLVTHRGCGRRFHPALVCDQCCGRLRGSGIMTA